MSQIGLFAPPTSLTIVIPALNEEEAIGTTIGRCLEAREEILQAAGLDGVEIIVVNDGSTDRTSEIAHGFEAVKVIDFARNRGYGAAIKEGFRQGQGSLVGFLDADGTCDPRYFADMCRVAVDDEADVVLGSRLGADSQMPSIRRVGNRIYAFLLGLFCGRQVTDTASGMRVLRRSALDHLYPLPDGMHFTPSMSARALLNGLRVVEIPMRYEERVGTSKLRVFQDGIQFLRTILAGVLCYRPERLFLMGFLPCLLLAMVLALHPTEFYLQNGRIEEWMIYRFVTCFFLGFCGFLLICATGLAHRMTAFGPRRREGNGFWPALVSNLFEGWVAAGFLGLTTVGSLALLFPGALEYWRSGHISPQTMHWSRILVGAFGLMVAFQTLVTGVLMQVLTMWRTQQADREQRSREQRLKMSSQPAKVA